ncbi:response regulator transcription factor [Streptomyces sp. NPDC001774]
MARLLVIDHELSETSRFVSLLRGHRNEVSLAKTGSEGIALALTEPPELIVMNLDLPDCSSLSLMRMIKSVGVIPIIVCGTDGHVIKGLRAGAESYLRKPYPTELALALIQSILAPDEALEEVTELKVGDLHMDLRAHCATLSGRHLNLRPKEFSLLSYLARHAGRVVSKQELINHVWGNSFGSTAKTIDVHLSWLRRRLGESAARPRYLYSVRGVGVKFTVPSARAGASASHSIQANRRA